MNEDTFEILRQIRKSNSTVINFIISYAFLTISMGWLAVDQYFLFALWFFFSLAVITFEIIKSYKELKKDCRNLERLRGKIEAVQEMKQMMEKRRKHRTRRKKK